MYEYIHDGVGTKGANACYIYVFGSIPLSPCTDCFLITCLCPMSINKCLKSYLLLLLSTHAFYMTKSTIHVDMPWAIARGPTLVDKINMVSPYLDCMLFRVTNDA